MTMMKRLTEEQEETEAYQQHRAEFQARRLATGDAIDFRVSPLWLDWYCQQGLTPRHSPNYGEFHVIVEEKERETPKTERRQREEPNDKRLGDGGFRLPHA